MIFCVVKQVEGRLGIGIGLVLLVLLPLGVTVPGDPRPCPIFQLAEPDEVAGGNAAPIRLTPGLKPFAPAYRCNVVCHAFFSVRKLYGKLSRTSAYRKLHKSF